MDDELIIDMKRMRDFEIDGKHFFITVQPGVIYSQIQQECFEKGAYVGGRRRRRTDLRRGQSAQRRLVSL